MLTAEIIKQKAKDLGFDLCGVAPAAAFPELGFLREWIDRGYAEPPPASVPDARVASLSEAVDWILRHKAECA